jgi:hypothetical protein
VVGFGLVGYLAGSRAKTRTGAYTLALIASVTVSLGIAAVVHAARTANQEPTTVALPLDEGSDSESADPVVVPPPGAPVTTPATAAPIPGTRVESFAVGVCVGKLPTDVSSTRVYPVACGPGFPLVVSASVPPGEKCPAPQYLSSITADDGTVWCTSHR